MKYSLLQVAEEEMNLHRDILKGDIKLVHTCMAISVMLVHICMAIKVMKTFCPD